MRHPPDVTDIHTGFPRPGLTLTQVTPTETALVDDLTTGDDRPGRAELLADVIEWLFVVFESRLGLTEIVACVHDCCRELDIDNNDETAVRNVEQRAFRRLSTAANLVEPNPAVPLPGIPSRPARRDGPRGPSPLESGY